MTHYLYLIMTHDKVYIKFLNNNKSLYLTNIFTSFFLHYWTCIIHLFSATFIFFGANKYCLKLEYVCVCLCVGICVCRPLFFEFYFSAPNQKSPADCIADTPPPRKTQEALSNSKMSTKRTHLIKLLLNMLLQ